MRELLFRGKQKSDKTSWVEGGIVQGVKHELWQNANRFYILYFPKFLSSPNLCEVDASTVGQYTGLKDRNGKKIFEGDILRFGDKVGFVNFSFGCFCVKYVFPDYLFRNNPAIDIVFTEWPNEVEVIGNIHDNPELIGGNNENAE